MGRIRGLLAASVSVLVLASVANAEQTLRWETTIDGAKQAARQSDRLVMIIFSAPWCQACRAMEAEVLSQPGVASALEANFVPVKVNVEYFPAAVRQYGITGLPTTVIITPTAQGEVLDSIRGRMPAGPDVARLNQVAADARWRSSGVVAHISGGIASDVAVLTDCAATPPPVSVAVVSTPTGGGIANDAARSATPPIAPGSVVMGNPQPVTPSAPADPFQPSPAAADRTAAAPSGNVLRDPPAPRRRRYRVRLRPRRSLRRKPRRPAVAGPPADAANPANPPSPPPQPQPDASAAPPAAVPEQPGNPPLGLDGFCPVQLTEKGVWSQGNRRWGAIHRGRTYLFAGPEEQRRFLAIGIICAGKLGRRHCGGLGARPVGHGHPHSWRFLRRQDFSFCR